MPGHRNMRRKKINCTNAGCKETKQYLPNMVDHLENPRKSLKKYYYNKQKNLIRGQIQDEYIKINCFLLQAITTKYPLYIS